LRWCRPAVRRYIDQFDNASTARGRTYYWLAEKRWCSIWIGHRLARLTAAPMWPVHAVVPARSTPCQPELFLAGKRG